MARSSLTYIPGLSVKLTQFWKGAIQESFQQNLVDIGSVVSEEKIFLNFITPFF
jgi:hypothetical protein